MRHTLLTGLVVGSLVVLVGCGSSTPPGPDSGTVHDSGVSDSGSGADAGGGTIKTLSTMNALPAPWSSSNTADFNADGGGAASMYLNGLVEFSAQTTTQGQFSDGGDCPAALQYQSYCDGFQANAAGGGSVLLDTYDFAGSPNSCASQDNGVMLSTLRGIWYDSYGAYAIAMTSCSDVGVGTGYMGSGTPPSTPVGSMKVGAYLATNPADGAAAVISGVVVAVSPVDACGDYTFAIEDPAGGPNSATTVYNSGAVPAKAPNIGDYVTVTGTWSKQYQNINL
jgi:hypothetical protein